MQQGGEEWVRNIGDDDANEIRAAEREVAPDFARHVVELLDGGLDLGPRGG